MKNEIKTAGIAMLALALCLFSVYAGQNHTLSQVYPIDVNFDLQGYNISGSGHLRLGDTLDSYVHFPDSSAGDGFSLQLDGGNYHLNIKGGTGGTSSHSSHLRLYGGDGTTQALKNLEVSGSLSVAGNFKAGYKTGNTYTLTADTASNRVGIGTSSPSRKLDIAEGEIQTASGYGIYFSGSDSETSRIYSSGNKVRIRAEGSDNVAEFGSHGLTLGRTGQTYNLVLAKGMKLESNDGVLNISDKVRLTGSGRSYFTGGNLSINTTESDAALRVDGEIVSIQNSRPFHLVPVGTIIVWSGSVGDIPDGWALCDGSPPTPDLRNKFVMGTTSEAEIGQIGGNEDVTLTTSNLPAHTHGGNTGDSPSHTHGGWTDEKKHSHTVSGTGSAGGHTHSFSTYSAGEHTHSPPSNPGSLSHDTHWCLPQGLTQGNCHWIPGYVYDPLEGTKEYTTLESHRHYVSTTYAGGHSHTFTLSTVNDHDDHNVVLNDAGEHAHDFTTDSSGSGNSFNNLPAYYEVAFIMRVSG